MSREAELTELHNLSEVLKEKVWAFLESWYPPEYGQVTAIKGEMNSLLDAIDSIED